MGKYSIIKERYGVMQYKMPTRDEVNEVIPTLHWYQRKKLNLSLLGSLILNAMITINTSPKRYERYKRVPIDYLHELQIRTHSQSLEQLVHRTFIRKLIYFYLYPEKYNNSFEDFCLPWITESLFIMRKSIMKQMIKRDEIPLIYNYGTISHPLYPFPYPLSIPSTISLSNTIHAILEPTLHIYAKQMNITL